MRQHFRLAWIVMTTTVAGTARAEPPAAEPEPPQVVEPAGEACVPSCRSGYACVDGACVEACNPPCPTGQRCTAEGECETASAAPDGNPSGSYWSESSDSDPSDDAWADAEAREPPATRRKSTGAMVTGIVLTGVGGVTALSGFYFLALPGPECDSYGGEEFCVGDDYSATGTTLLIAGGVLAAVGIPLILYGSSRVPARGDLAHPRLEPTVLVGTNSVRVRWTW